MSTLVFRHSNVAFSTALNNHISDGLAVAPLPVPKRIKEEVCATDEPLTFPPLRNDGSKRCLV